MGSFNVTCGISGISMEKNKAVLVPLIQSRHPGDLYNGATISSWVEGNRCCALFRPFAPPLFGTLDTYGRLEEIEEDVSTRALEKFYKIPIQDFAEVIACGEHTDAKINKVDVSSWGGMYVHRQIYDMMVSLQIDEWGRPEEPVWSSQGLLDHEILGELGFKYVKQERGSENNLPSINLYANPKFPEIELRHTSQSSVQVTCGKKQTMWECKIKTVVEAIEKWAGRPLVPQKKRKLWQTTNAAYLRMARLTTEERTRKDLGDTLYAMHLARRLGFGVEGTDFADIYFDALRDRSFTDILAGFRLFMNNMFDMNKFFSPTMHGLQFGNHYASEALFEKSLEIVKKLKRKSED